MRRVDLWDGIDSKVTSLDHLVDAMKLTEELINDLDELALAELLSGNQNDIEVLFNEILNEFISVLRSEKQPETNYSPQYLDNFGASVQDTFRRVALNYFILDVLPDFEMSWHHVEWGNIAQLYKFFCVIAARDHGKTLSKNELIPMYDGSLKKVQDIVVGDIVMGVDSTPRNVIGTHTVIDDGYEIVQPAGGITYKVSAEHILHFKRDVNVYVKGNRKKTDEEIVEMSANDFYNKSSYYKEKSFGYRIKGWDLPKKDLLIDPYFLGLWLGDGDSNRVCITTMDQEILDYINKIANDDNLKVTQYINYSKGKAYSYNLSGGNRGRYKKPFLINRFEDYSLFYNKHIPEIYFQSSRQQRLELLAGLIDTDGHVHHKDGQVQFGLSNEKLVKDIQRLSWSLGFRAIYKSRFKKLSYGDQRQYEVHNLVISGDIHQIPTKIERKKILKRDRVFDSQKSKLKIEKIEKQRFYGFEVDGDHLHLLKDGTVVHNSHFYSFAYVLWKLYRYTKQNGLYRVKKEYTLSREGMLLTNEFSLAKHFLDKVKTEIEDNPILNKVLYGGKSEGSWGKDEIMCKNGSSLFVKSYGSRMRGRHPSFIIADDFLNDHVLYSQTQRDKYINLFNSVVGNMIVPNGQVGIVGTPFHGADLYGYIKKVKGWRVFEYPAIFPDGTLLWEGRHNLKNLLEKRETQGSIIFSREILCRPVTNESSIFPYQILRRSLLGMDAYKYVDNIQSFPMGMNRVVEGCDFAISATAAADYSAFFTLGITKRDETEHYWILNVWHEKGKSFKDQRAKLKSKFLNFNFDIAVLESIQMQQIFVQAAEEDGLPVEGHATSAKSKFSLEEGIPSLAILFEQGRIHFPYGDEYSKSMTDMIFDQLTGMAWSDKGIESTTEHDDLVMGLLMAIIAARKSTGFGYAFLQN